jgi:hypothetical protein
MKLRYTIPLSVVFVFLYCSLSYPEISQNFDSNGNSITSGSSRSIDRLSRRTHRNSVPEGIELQNDIQYEFYPVFGKTFSEIVRSAEENSPVDLKGKKRLPSRFEWSVGWSYKVDHSTEIDESDNTPQEEVEIYDVNITYNIKITLPTLIDDTVLNPSEKNLWKNYYHTLVQYEHDHARIIRDDDAKKELLSKFSDLDYMIFDYTKEFDIQKAVETLIKKETESIGSAWVKDLKKRIDAYDRATEYGLALQNRESFFKQK